MSRSLTYEMKWTWCMSPGLSANRHARNANIADGYLRRRSTSLNPQTSRTIHQWPSAATSSPCCHRRTQRSGWVSDLRNPYLPEW